MSEHTCPECGGNGTTRSTGPAPWDEQLECKDCGFPNNNRGE